MMRRLADPVLSHLAEGTLKTRMPVEQAPGADRRSVTHLEALGRLLAGMAPWLELGPDNTEEGRLREHYGALARRALTHAVDPASPDFLNFTKDRQPLVDAAFLGQALLRAPKALRDGLDDTTKRHLIAALESSRVIVPNYNNLAALHRHSRGRAQAARRVVGSPSRRLCRPAARAVVQGRRRVRRRRGFSLGLLRQLRDPPHDARRAGRVRGREAGVEESGAARRPARATLRGDSGTSALRRTVRFRRSAARSAYRFGASHLLAQMALRRALPDGVTPAQVRGALTGDHPSVHRGVGNVDAGGWLQIGLGHRLALERPTSRTGSCICSVGLLRIGSGGNRRILVGRRPTLESVRAGQARRFDRSLSRSWKLGARSIQPAINS